MTGVVVAATPLAGHTLPLLRIAAGLLAAGHDVTFVGGMRLLPDATALGLRTRALVGRADYDDRDLATAFPASAALPPGLERINAETAEVFGDVIPDQYAVLQDLLRDDPEAVLVTDILFGGAFPSACGAGRRPRRWISVGIAPVYARSVDTTPFGPAPVEPGQDAEAANLAGCDAFSGAVSAAFEHVMGIVRELGGRPDEPDWVSTLYDLPDLTAQLSVPEFEFPRRDLPASIHYVGLVPPPAPAWTPPDWWQELGGTRPVVLVTQGTVANRDLTELVAPTLAGLADAECLVVAALGRPTADLDAGLPAVPANARVVEYAPFAELLPFVDVFVTNGGYGATQQALAAGVPVVVAGASEDKPATAARVAFHGVGVDLGTQRPAAEQVRAAVERLLAEPGFRARAGELAAAYAQHDALAQIAAMISRP